MANETTVQASYIQKIPDADNCLGNIPPKVPAASETSKLGVQEEDAVVHSFTQPSEENGPLSDTCTFSTPAQKGGNGGKKENPQLSGYLPALTPILKSLNIVNNRPSPGLLKHVFSTKKRPNSTGESVHHPSSDLSTISFGRSGDNRGAPVCLLDFEYLPDITLFDVTCDPTVEMTINESVLSESAVAAPKVGEANNTKPSGSQKLVEKTNLNSNVRTDVLCENKVSHLSPGILERYLPDITLLEVSHDSELSPVGHMHSMNITQDTSALADMKINRAVSDLSEEAQSSDTVQNEDLSSASLQSVKCGRENAIKMSMEETKDIMGKVVENIKTSSELSEQNKKPQASDEEALDAKPVNITHDISSSHKMSAKCAGLSASGLQSIPSSKRVIAEWDAESMEKPDAVEVVNEKLLTSRDTELASQMLPKNSEEMDVSENGTSTSVQPSNLSDSSDLNSSAAVSCPEKKTLDLPAPSVDSQKEECESTDEMGCATTKLPCTVNQNGSSVKESNEHEIQNATFDLCSLQKSSGSTALGEDVTTSLHLKNNTFDCKPPAQQNATLTLSEITSSDSHPNTLEKSSSPKVCSLTISLKDNSSEAGPSEMLKQKTTSVAAEPKVNVQENPSRTFEANPVSETVSGSDESEGRGHSESGPPMTDGLSDASSHQSVETEDNKAGTFNLDETLDLKADHMITSTPMPNCKINNCDKEREAGKTLAAQKKLYGDGPSKPSDQPPSNIVCGRKTFLTQHAPKFLKPPSKVTSQLLKNKPGSTLPCRHEPGASCLPTKRQRTQPEPARSAASQEPQGTTGITGSYNLRSTTAASKLPSSGLQRPQLSGIPSAVQRSRPGLRLPSARANGISSSSTEKSSGPTAANAVTRNEQGKKHPLTSGEAIPVKKRKQMDAVVPSSISESSALAFDTTNKTTNMKQPTASQRALPAKYQRNVPSAETSTLCDVSSRGRVIKQPATSHRALLTKPPTTGCAKCSALEAQLKEQSEEIQRLKEELLKYKK